MDFRFKPELDWGLTVVLSFISWIPALSWLSLNPMHLGRNYTGIVNKPGVGPGRGSNFWSPWESGAKGQELDLWTGSA